MSIKPIQNWGTAKPATQTSVIRVTPRTTTMEAKNRRATYLTSISPYISSPAALELPPLKSLAVRDEHLGRPRPQLELVERAEIRALDALVDAPDAGVEED